MPDDGEASRLAEPLDVTEPAASEAVSAPRAGMRATALRMLSGSERPWDPSNRLGLLILCMVLIVVLSVAYDHFFTVDNAFTILLNITAIGIAAFGSAMLIISGNVDLSIGGMYALVAVADRHRRARHPGTAPGRHRGDRRWVPCSASSTAGSSGPSRSTR